MPRNFRIYRAREDADDFCDMIVRDPHYGPRWWCDDCGQLNDPEQQGGDWPTCVHCGHFREDVAHLAPEHIPEWADDDA